ncbi:MAG: glucose 1-dehydrogenase [Gemmatimonadetes bacterium]|nr:glucose 1-dehydrogenase [Gemmatimonadota bacterium]
MRLMDRVAIVTGGNSGIGRAAATLFAEEGASVLIAARDPEKSATVVEEVREGGGIAASVVCDVRVPTDCERAVAAAVEEFGRLDVLFNNAGVIYRERTAPTTSVQEWDSTFDVNTRGTFLMSKFAVPEMAKNPGGGAIVNNASYLGLVGTRGAAAYCASKGAVVLLTRAMALDHGPDGIRVNCICPGSVDTPMLRNEMEEMGGVEKVRSLFEEKHPQGRIASPEEIAEAALYLASDAARFVTGACLPVDGGITAG